MRILVERPDFELSRPRKSGAFKPAQASMIVKNSGPAPVKKTISYSGPDNHNLPIRNRPAFQSRSADPQHVASNHRRATPDRQQTPPIRRRTSQAGRIVLIILFLIAVLVVLIPLWGKMKTDDVMAGETIRVLMPSGTISTMVLEEYLIGVVAAEMPAAFETEALKAQAVASRTFAARRTDSALANGDAYDVDTTTATQVWLSDAQLRERWGVSYGEDRAKIAAAVRQTSGEVLMFDDTLATTVFFSNTGRLPTENSTDVWGGSYSYLSSVSSPETAAPDEYVRQKSMSKEAFLDALSLSRKQNLQASDLKVLERTKAGRIATLSVAGKTIKGTDFRRALDLASTDIEWKISGDQITFTTYGSGHAVGLSQYGAQNMALSGKGYQEILAHYYQGTQLEPAYFL
ncbi:MAG: stage II sporulation protein D [Gracilibacteraceae bacterium]|jgi:stage II sporulation protein D|nr:stage II sporulation protein D [Gracilibacteraceae bacterium]